MKKRALAVLLTGVLAAGILTGCGSAAEEAETETAAAQEEQEEAAPAESEDTGEESGDAEEESPVEEKGTITVAASPTPHAEILEVAKPILAEQGWNLEITQFDDYILPNQVVDSGEMDANYFQHIPYLDEFNAERGTRLVNAGGIHYEPFGIYPGTKKSLDEIADGDVIAVPNDTTNEARALLLLQDNGLITLEEGAGLTATVQDIVENPHNLEIKELEAAQVPRVVEEVAFVVLNGNYALQANFSVAKIPSLMRAQIPRRLRPM